MRPYLAPVFFLCLKLWLCLEARQVPFDYLNGAMFASARLFERGIFEVLTTLRRGLKAMTDDEAFRAALGKLGERGQYLDSAALQECLRQDYANIDKVLRQIIQR